MTDQIYPSPDLGDDQIVRMVSGLRPCRRGGLRIESERFGQKTVIHNYGQGGCGVTIGFGCAALVLDLVRHEAEAKEPIGILGGGVTGLTVATELLNAGFPVRVYASRWTDQTTSNVAGALWLPTGIEPGDSPEQRAQLDWILQTSRTRFATIDRARFGVEELPVFEPACAPFCPEYFRPGTIDDPTPLDRLPLSGPVRSGRCFKTDFIHTPRFLDELLKDINATGGDTVTTEFSTLEAIRNLPERVLINCLALGSRSLFGDDRVYPAYGMLVHMKPQRLGYICHDGYKYLFPREDALILGGCFVPDRWDTEPDDSIGREIIDHHRRFFSEAEPQFGCA